MREFDDCSELERETLEKMSRGFPIEELEPEIIRSLAQKNLLEDFQGTLIVPAIVWNQWNKFKSETGWAGAPAPEGTQS